MSCRALIYVAWCCLPFWVGACRQAERVVPVSYKQHFPIDTAIAVETHSPGDHLVSPGCIDRMGDRILVFGGYDEVGIYSYPDLNFVKKVTLPSISGTLTTVDDGFIYRVSGGNVDRYVLRNDSLYRDSSFVVAQSSETIGAVQELSSGVYIYADGSHFSGMHEFHIMDINCRHCISKGEYPEGNERFKRLRDFKFTYKHSVYVKPDKSSFVVVYGRLRRVRIYDKDGELLHDVFLEDAPGNYKVIPVDYSEWYFHFSSGATTEKYIYLMDYNTPTYPPTKARSNLLVLDWQGNLVAKYRLNVLMHGMFVDEQSNTVYGTGWKPETGIVFFTMNMLHNKY